VGARDFESCAAVIKMQIAKDCCSLLLFLRRQSERSGLRTFVHRRAIGAQERAASSSHEVWEGHCIK
jgi:hypothetical protein